jgi:hypothetical protein
MFRWVVMQAQVHILRHLSGSRPGEQHKRGEKSDFARESLNYTLFDSFPHSHSCPRISFLTKGKNEIDVVYTLKHICREARLQMSYTI